MNIEIFLQKDDYIVKFSADSDGEEVIRTDSNGEFKTYGDFEDPVDRARWFALEAIVTEGLKIVERRVNGFWREAL